MDKTLFTVDDFLFEPHQRARVSLPARSKKGSKNETHYEQEHIDMFAIEGWPWPPSEEAMQQTCGDLPSLTQRSREIVYFANMKWDFPDSVDVQFIDANCSLDRLVRMGRSPWSDNAPLTLVGSTQLVMRRRGGLGQRQRGTFWATSCCSCRAGLSVISKARISRRSTTRHCAPWQECVFSVRMWPLAPC